MDPSQVEEETWIWLAVPEMFSCFQYQNSKLVICMQE